MENIFGASLDPEVLRRQAMAQATREQAMQMAQLAPHQQVAAQGAIFGGGIGDALGTVLLNRGIALGPTAKAVQQERELGRMQDEVGSQESDPLKALATLRDKLQAKGMGRQAQAVGERIDALRQSRLASAAEAEKAAAEVVYKTAQAEKLIAEVKQMGKPAPTEFEKARQALVRAQESGDPEAIADANLRLEALQIAKQTEGMSSAARDAFLLQRAREKGDTAMVAALEDARRQKVKETAAGAPKVLIEDAGDLSKVAGLMDRPMKSADVQQEALGNLNATENMLAQVYEVASKGLTGGPLIGDPTVVAMADALRVAGDAFGLTDFSNAIENFLTQGSLLDAAIVEPLLERLKAVGGNDTEREMKEMQKTLPGRMNTPQAIADIARMMRITLDQGRVKEQNIATFRAKVPEMLAKAVAADDKAMILRLSGLSLNRNGVTGDPAMDRTLGLTPLPTYAELAKKYPPIPVPKGTFTPGVQLDPVQRRSEELFNKIIGGK